MNFDTLSLKKRASILGSEGKFLAIASRYQHRINLYSLKGEFIELWYNVITNDIEKIIPMGKSKLFRLYFKKELKDSLVNAAELNSVDEPDLTK